MQTDLGKLLWECPAPKPASKRVHQLFGWGLIACGLFIGLILLVSLWSLLSTDAAARGNDGGGAASPAMLAILGALVPVAMIIGGTVILLGGLSPRAPAGEYFFERGLEWGPPGKRTRAAYQQLEYLVYEPFTAADKAAKNGAATAKLVVSILAQNPHGISTSLGELGGNYLHFKEVRGISRFKLPAEREIKIPVFPEGEKLLQTLHARFQKRNQQA